MKRPMGLNLVLYFFTLFTSLVFASSPTDLVSAKTQPRVLILSAAFGFGHESAARALQAQILEKYPNALIETDDFTRYSKNEFIRQAGIHSFRLLTQHAPQVYDAIFRAEALKHAGQTDYLKMVPPTYNLEALQTRIQEYRPDLILNTFNLAAVATAGLRQHGHIPSDTVLVFQHTDYGADPYYFRHFDSQDLSLIPHESIFHAAVEDGVPAEKMRVTGISTSPKYSSPVGEEERKQLREKLKLNDEQKNILFFSGKNAVGDFDKIIRELTKNPELLGQSIRLTVVTGENDSVKKRVQKLSKELPKNFEVDILGLMKPDEAADLVRSADVIVGKAGGLTSTEIFRSQVPVVFLNINGGQEAFNIDLFEKEGAGLSAVKPKETAQKLAKLLLDPNLQIQMKQKQAEFIAKMGQSKNFVDWLEKERVLHLDPKQDPFAHFETYRDKGVKIPLLLEHNKRFPVEKRNLEEVSLTEEQRARLGMAAHERAFRNFAMEDGTFRLVVLDPKQVEEVRVILEPWRKLTGKFEDNFSYHSSLNFKMKKNAPLRLFPQTLEALTSDNKIEPELRQDYMLSFEGTGVTMLRSGKAFKGFSLSSESLDSISFADSWKSVSGHFPAFVRAKEMELSIAENMNPGFFDARVVTDEKEIRTMHQHRVDLKPEEKVGVLEYALSSGLKKGGNDARFKLLTGANCSDFTLCMLKTALGVPVSFDPVNWAPGTTPYRLKKLGILDPTQLPRVEEEDQHLLKAIKHLDKAGFGHSSKAMRLKHICDQVFGKTEDTPY